MGAVQSFRTLFSPPKSCPGLNHNRPVGAGRMTVGEYGIGNLCTGCAFRYEHPGDTSESPFAADPRTFM